MNNKFQRELLKFNKKIQYVECGQYTEEEDIFFLNVLQSVIHLK
jgi:hypothetical protein